MKLDLKLNPTCVRLRQELAEARDAKTLLFRQSMESIKSWKDRVDGLLAELEKARKAVRGAVEICENLSPQHGETEGAVKAYWDDWGPVRTFLAGVGNVLWGIGEAVEWLIRKRRR